MVLSIRIIHALPPMNYVHFLRNIHATELISCPRPEAYPIYIITNCKRVSIRDEAVWACGLHDFGFWAVG